MAIDTQARVFSDLAVPPGELLAEELDVRRMTQRELADRTGRPEQKISEIISGRKRITDDTALELEKVLGIPAEFWINLQAAYQLALARIRERIELEKQEDWLDFFPVREMRARQFLPGDRDKQTTLTAILKFFGVASFPALTERQRALIGQYRITPKTTVSEGALWAWLRAGDLKAQDVDTAPYDEAKFKDVLQRIRQLTRKPIREAVEEAIRLCAEAGVVLVVVQHFPKTGANGVARWLSADRAMIQLSTLRSWQDIFWFSFFHEADHILGRQKKKAFVNGINDEPDAEEAANHFAADMLIPAQAWNAFAESRSFSSISIEAFAKRLGIAPGIVVGRLQHEKLIAPQNLNHLRPRIVWIKEEATT